MENVSTEVSKSFPGALCCSTGEQDLESILNKTYWPHKFMDISINSNPHFLPLFVTPDCSDTSEFILKYSVCFDEPHTFYCLQVVLPHLWGLFIASLIMALSATLQHALKHQPSRMVCRCSLRFCLCTNLLQIASNIHKLKGIHTNYGSYLD